MSINLSISGLSDKTVLESSLENRRKFIIEFLREHPQDTVVSICRLYQVDPEAIYKYRKRTRKETRKYTRGGYNTILLSAQDRAVI